MNNLEQFLVFFPERVALVMNIIAHESQWFPAMSSITNIANWSAKRAASLSREASAMDFTDHKSLYFPTRDSSSLISTDLNPKHQYWLLEVIRQCSITNPHLISSLRKILYFLVPILLAVLSHICHIFTFAWHHQGNRPVVWQVSCQVNIPYTFSRRHSEIWISKKWFFFLSSDRQQLVSPNSWSGFLGDKIYWFCFSVVAFMGNGSCLQTCEQGGG